MNREHTNTLGQNAMGGAFCEARSAFLASALRGMRRSIATDTRWTLARDGAEGTTMAFTDAMRRSQSSTKSGREPQTQSGNAQVENSETSDKYVRLAVNLTPDAAHALRQFADARGINATEAVRRMIALVKFIDDETGRGNRLSIVDPETRDIREIQLL